MPKRSLPDIIRLKQGVRRVGERGTWSMTDFWRLRLVMPSRTYDLCTRAAAAMGIGVMGFVLRACMSEAIRVLLATDHRPVTLQKGALLWTTRGGETRLHSRADGLEKAWLVCEELCDRAVSPSGRALRLDVVGGPRGVLVSPAEVTLPVPEPAVDQRGPRYLAPIDPVVPEPAADPSPPPPPPA